jgi:hypothetical protein
MPRRSFLLAPPVPTASGAGAEEKGAVAHGGMSDLFFSTRSNGVSSLADAVAAALSLLRFRNGVRAIAGVFNMPGTPY